MKSTKFLPPALIAAIALIAFSGGYFVSVIQNNANHKTENLQADQIAQCQRANIARQQLLNLYDALIVGNAGRADAWKERVTVETRRNDPPTFIHADKRQVQANLAEVRGLRSAEQDFVSSQALVSAHPDSPNFHRRAEVDCQVAFN